MRHPVLIVSPSREGLEVLSNKLHVDYCVFTAGNLGETLHLLRKQPFRLIICLAGVLPDSGYALCRQLKQDSASAQIPVLLVTAEDGPEVRAMSLEAGASGHIGGTVFREHLDKQMRQLILQQLRERRHGGSGAIAVPKGGEQVEKELLLKKLHDCLDEHARHKGLNVDLLAKLMHMSRPTLYRKLKTLTDHTPNEIINEARLKKAADLLAAGEHRVFEVARMLGYTSQSSFGKLFLKQFKVTPATYQRMKKIMDAA